MALLVGLLNKRGLLLIPALLIAFTLFRATNGVHYSIMTHFRIDEILAGAMLALIYNDKLNGALNGRYRVRSGGMLSDASGKNQGIDFACLGGEGADGGA